MPDAWEQALAEGMSDDSPDLAAWWESFDDPALTGLVQRAVRGNLDLTLAAARIREARALRMIAAGERYPDVDATGEALRTRLSEETTPATGPGVSRHDNLFSAAIEASWEADVWGRIDRSVESADAGVEASVETYRDVLVLLCAEVALNYVDVRTLQARIAYAQANVRAQSDILKLTEDRHRAELAPELDVTQATLNVRSTEATIPTLRVGLNRAVHRIAVLLGEYPAAMRDELTEPQAIPLPPAAVAVGVPADLLRRRPDVRRAERELAAQTARIGVATADLYPRFLLLGSFGMEAREFDEMFNAGARTYTLGPIVRWNLFDGGRVRGAIEVQDARAEQALARYEQTVLRAVEDVENALVSFAQEQQRRESLAGAVEAAERSVELFATLYRLELTDFQDVLDVQRLLVVQQDQLAESEGIIAGSLIRLYRSLGGGWDAGLPAGTEGN